MSDIRIEKYEIAHLNNWDSFIDESINGTIFHRQKFIAYHHKDRFEDASLLFYQKGKLLSVFPAAIVKKQEKKILKSHPGTSYGGFVFNSTIPLRKVFEMLEVLEAHCKENYITNIEFRMAPKIFNSVLLDQVDFALVRNNYVRLDEELATFYSIKSYKYEDDFSEYFKQFPPLARNQIKKAYNHGVTAQVVVDDKDIGLFYKILADNLKAKFDKEPTHNKEEYELLLKLFPEDIFVFGVYKDSKLIGGFMALRINKQGVHIFYGCMNYKYQEYRPQNIGLARLIQHVQLMGMKVLNYGISTEDGGKYINWDLLWFKENFGGTGVLRTYWQKKL